MRIAIHSASASVTRTIETIISASGHQYSRESSADLVIIDAQHPPSTSPPNGASLTLVSSPETSANENATLTCPLRHERLAQRLLMLANTQRVALAHGWSLDMLARTLAHSTAAPINLTEKESILLKHLLLAHPAPLSREALLEQVWGMANAIDTHTLETHIYRLRNKLEALAPRPCDIRTHEGAYLLAFDAQVG